MSDYPLLSSPLDLGAHRAPNRIVSTAHGEQMCHGGRIPQELVDYHARRALGGVGTIVAFGSGTVHPGADNPGNVSLWDPENEAALHELAQQVRSEGTVLLAQASHRGVRETPTSLDAALVAPSPAPGPPPLGSPHVLSAHEILDIVGAYGGAAARLARCGFSGIELTALGSHLMEQFWSPTVNRRDDAYGGNFRNRMRLTREIVAEVTRAVPEDFLVCFRITGDPQTDAMGLSQENMMEIAAHIAALGCVDVFSVSGGSGANIETHAGNVPTEAYPVATYADLAASIRAVVSLPVIVAGRVLDPATAEEILHRGQADLVGMTRALIADPDLPRWVLGGAPERARPCIAINEGCRRVITGRRLACTVNPAVADPTLDAVLPTRTPRRVSVVGGGPAGMEAARVAAERGHQVVLTERADQLGGQLAIAATEPDRPHLGRHVAWMARELNRLGVTVQLDTDADVETLLGNQPDAIVVATGSTAVTPPELTPGSTTVCTDVDLLTGSVPTAGVRTATVVDAQGHRRGAAAALRLAQAGAQVRLVSPFLEPLAHLETPNKPPLLRLLTAESVACLTSHELVTRAGPLQLRHHWSDRVLPVEEDLLVTVGWTDVPTGLGDALSVVKRPPHVHVIGDAQAPRLLRTAISEGAHVGNRL